MAICFSSFDCQMMEQALCEARRAFAGGEVPVGAVVVDEKGNIIGRGYNLRAALHDLTAHAEIVALREAAQALGGWNLSGCSLFVTLEPCPMCAGALVQARIARVVFGCRDERAGACGSLYSILRDGRLNHRCDVAEGLMADECRSLLQSFFLAAREKKRQSLAAQSRFEGVETSRNE